MLVNMRVMTQSSMDDALADINEKNSEGKPANSFSYILVPLKIAMRQDPLDYVHAAKAIMDRKKCSLEAFGNSAVAKLIFKFFGIKASCKIFLRVPTQTTLVFSNMPGPLEEIAYYDNPITYLAPACYGNPQALMIHIQSYMNKMAIVLTVDERIIPDPHQLCDDFEESLKLIKDAVVARGIVKDI